MITRRGSKGKNGVGRAAPRRRLHRRRLPKTGDRRTNDGRLCR